MSAPDPERAAVAPSGSSELPRPRTAREMLAMARAFLERKSIDEARLEAELLVARALGLDRLGLFLQLERPVSNEEIDRARDLFVRRGRREPVAYIVGAREFYGRDFEVTPEVLIPRPDTELLVDLARERWAERGLERAPLVADLGTGSGCIAVTIALELRGARVVAVDRSAGALAVAERNAERHGAQVEMLEGDGIPALEAWIAARGERFDLLLANPPYVSREERDALAPEVRDYEPELALYAPPGDPDHWVRRIAERFDALVAPEGRALVELAAGRSDGARAIAASMGLAVRTGRDLAGHERVLELERP